MAIFSNISFSFVFNGRLKQVWNKFPCLRPKMKMKLMQNSNYS